MISDITGRYGKGIFAQAAGDFDADQRIQIEGILCVFRNLNSAELGQKIRCPDENQFFIVTVNYRLISSFSLTARAASAFLIILSSISCRSFSAFFCSSSVISEAFFSFLT